MLETHRLEIENGVPVEDLAGWFQTEQPNFSAAAYGFQEFSEFLNYAQDKTVVRLEPHEEQGLIVFLGAEFYPPAEPDGRRRSTPKKRRTNSSPSSRASRPLRAESSAGQAQAGAAGAQTGRLREYRPSSPF